MGETLARTETVDAELLERVVVGGDLSKLSPAERMRYYAAVCQSVGLNPMTQPFQYLYLQNKMTLYARKEATEQLRELRGVSVTRLEHTIQDGIWIVTAYGRTKSGRTDAATGAMMVEGLGRQDKANAIMKAETKAKRRLTLSLCGLGLLDESEVDVPEGARLETEVVMLPSMIPGQEQAPLTPFGQEQASKEMLEKIAPGQAQATISTPMLFPTPEEDRAGLIQRARVAMARLNKGKVAGFKALWLGGPDADLATVDLAALLAFTVAVEGEKL